ncbi:ferredoxin [Streptomyces sp. NPDC059371]|uniref:ferredoxin n=1 Tax=Streptomyces sp. NPDC059371 TaxID=3346812 RepID=UPI0036D0108A
MSTGVGIAIGKDVRTGTGQYALAAPGVLAQDDDGFSALLPDRPQGDGGPMPREVVPACPVGAVTVTEQTA